MSVFKKPVSRDVPSVYRARPSPAEAGVKKTMDSIGSAMEAVRAAYSLDGKQFSENTNPTTDTAGEFPGMPAGNPSRPPTLSKTGKRLIGLAAALAAGPLLGIWLASQLFSSGPAPRETAGSGRDYTRDARECDRQYRDLPSTAYAVAVTECMERRGHNMNFVREPNR